MYNFDVSAIVSESRWGARCIPRRKKRKRRRKKRLRKRFNRFFWETKQRKRYMRFHRRKKVDSSFRRDLNPDKKQGLRRYALLFKRFVKPVRSKDPCNTRFRYRVINRALKRQQFKKSRTIANLRGPAFKVSRKLHSRQIRIHKRRLQFRLGSFFSLKSTGLKKVQGFYRRLFGRNFIFARRDFYVRFRLKQKLRDFNNFTYLYIEILKVFLELAEKN